MKVESKVAWTLAGYTLREFAFSIMKPSPIPLPSNEARRVYLKEQYRRLEKYSIKPRFREAHARQWQQDIVSALQELIDKSLLKDHRRHPDLLNYEAEPFFPTTAIKSEEENTNMLKERRALANGTAPFRFIKRMLVDWLIGLGFDTVTAFVHTCRYDSYFMLHRGAERPRKLVMPLSFIVPNSAHNFPLLDTESYLFQVVDSYSLISKYLRPDPCSARPRVGNLFETEKGKFMLHDTDATGKHFAVTNLETLKRFHVIDYIAFDRSAASYKHQAKDVLLDLICKYQYLMAGKYDHKDRAAYLYLLQVHAFYRFPLISLARQNSVYRRNRIQSERMSFD